jgi:CRP-like cAMP-binding protein
LPRPDQQRLLAAAEVTPLEFRDVLYEPGELIRHVYFPTTAVVSMIADLPDAPGIEVAVMGPEGMVGVSVVWGVRMKPVRFIVQAAGNALRLEASRFHAEAERPGPLREMLGRYSAALLTQIAQTAACNGLHTIRQRCVRWLLMMHDCVRTEEFPLTQEFFAEMLGVRRASIVEVARQLQRSGMIHYHRGVITIRNRDRLENASCPCYHIVRREYERLLGKMP